MRVAIYHINHVWPGLGVGNCKPSVLASSEYLTTPGHLPAMMKSITMHIQIINTRDEIHCVDKFKEYLVFTFSLLTFLDVFIMYDFRSIVDLFRSCLLPRRPTTLIIKLDQISIIEISEGLKNGHFSSEELVRVG